MTIKRLALAGFCAAMFTSPAQAITLLEAYQAAKTHDPEYLAARAEHEAGSKHVYIGAAALLPQVQLSLYRAQNDGWKEYPRASLLSKTPQTARDDLDYKSKHYQLQVRQTIFDWRKISEFRQARSRTQQSFERMHYHQNNLALRVTQAYFDALLAQQTLDLLNARVTAYDEQFIRAQKLYQAGEGTLTDIDEARAKRDIAFAQRIETTDQLRIALQNMRNITGQHAQTLTRLAENFPLTPPQPAALEDWLDLARKNSPELRVAQSALEISDRELDKAWGGFLPSVELVGNVTRSESDSLSTLQQTNHTRSVGVQVSIPLFNGGHTLASTAQQAALRTQQKHILEATRQRIESQVTTAFHGTLSGISKIRGHEQAVKSSQAALNSTRMGFRAGLRTNADILDAEEQLFQAKRNLAEARHQYLLNALSLRAHSGILLEEDVERLDEFLEWHNKKSPLAS